jgi:hypothetical protein
MRKSQDSLLLGSAAASALASSSTLPDGKELKSWEQALHFTHTFYVNNQAANADDNGPGDQQKPFRTIGRAASQATSSPTFQATSTRTPSTLRAATS